MPAHRRPISRSLPLLAAVLLLVGLAWLLRPDATSPPPALALPADGAPRVDARRQALPLPGFLPPEAAPVVRHILAGGPFPHRQDGSVFHNREGHLPRRGRGHYREYTVPTPGLDHRGARRIVTGGDPPAEWYYTANHYGSFRAFAVAGTQVRR